MVRSISPPPTFTLAKVGAIFRRDARVAISYTGQFVLSWLMIIVEVVIAWYISRLISPSSKFGTGGAVVSYFQFLAVNFAFVHFQSAALTSFAGTIRESQLTGTLEVVLATPTTLPVLVLSSGAWSFTLTGLQTSTYLILAMLFGLDLSHVNVLTAIVFLILTVAAVSPLGVFAAALAMVIKKPGPIADISTNSSQLFGGVFLPLSSLPIAMQAIGWCLPITHSLAGFRAATAGAPLTAVSLDAIWLFVASVVLMPLSLWLFARAVRKARIDGTLAMY